MQLNFWTGHGGRSTRMKIGLAFAGLAAVLFAAVGGLSGQHVRDEMSQRSGETLQHIGSRLVGALDAGMFERYREIQNLATLQSLIDAEVDADAWRALLDRLQATLPYYSWIGFADTQGKVIAATGGLLEGRDVSARPWFAEGLRGPAVGDVHDALLLASLLPRRPAAEPLRLVDFSAPVRFGDRTTGVLGAHLDLRWADDLRRAALASGEVGGDVEIIVLSRSGTVLLGPPAPQVLSWHPTQIADLSHGPPRIRTWSDGRAYLTAALPTRGQADYPGIGWTIVVRQPADAALASADALRQRIWLYGLFGALLFGLAGWWLSGWVTAPLRAIALQARRLVGAKDADEHSPLGGPNEIAQLAGSLTQLVAQLRQREQELLELTSTLEARVVQRTALLDDANAELRSFGRSVSHDIRGPIAAMGQVVDMLLHSGQHPLADPTRKALVLVRGECARMTALVDELMLLAQVEERPLSFGPVPMEALVDQVLAGLHDGRTTAVVHRPLPVAHGDEVLLRQVWQNLLANAYKFSSRVMSPRLEIRCRREGDEWIYEVQDNGAGFDMAVSEHLFGAFRRLHSTADFPGTGVGLSLVKRIVHRHGGRVGARSEVGRGALFFFSLPLQPPQG